MASISTEAAPCVAGRSATRHLTVAQALVCYLQAQYSRRDGEQQRLIPAIFGITQDPFIVYTSNVFAILGLRAMYFLLAGVLNRLRFLTLGLSFVLTFIGGKMIAHKWVDIPEHISLLVVAGILLLALAASLLFPKRSGA